MERSDIKANLRTAAGGRERARCDLCRRNRNLHLHELIDRKYTSKNEAARALSYQAELVVLICPECHDKLHRTSPAQYRNALFNVNYQRYGTERVQAAFTALKAVLPTLPFQLPEEE